METSGGGMLGRLAEKAIGWVAAALLLLLGIAVWRMGPEARGAILSAVGRTLGWVVIAATLPWVTRFFIGRLLEVGSNWAGVVLIAVLTLIDLVAGLVLMNGWPSGGWGWTAALAALAVAGTYNYLVAEYLAEQQGG